MKHRISAEMYKSKHARAVHPVFAINGISLDIWLSERLLSSDWASGLVPAQGWLIDDDELALAWRRIEHIEDESSTIVPVLVCSDDVDLSCSVIVVEQLTTSNEVIWCRFGWPNQELGDQCGAAVKWFADSPSCAFDRTEFEAALTEFKRLRDEEWK